jgi:hypothetical protein
VGKNAVELRRPTPAFVISNGVRNLVLHPRAAFFLSIQEHQVFGLGFNKRGAIWVVRDEISHSVRNDMVALWVLRDEILDWVQNDKVELGP